ncbi:MAG: GIY-YIG nuclease family protein [candidate division Zixibacteria bacterium]|nr:GIY-YIG nuclease family protein [candidate division Zixibacteria bacterium]
MNAFVYILRDQNGKYYIGSTTDLKRRMNQHDSGHTRTTRNMNFPKLIFSQQYQNLDSARKIERKLKKLKRKDYIDNIIKDQIIKMNP